MKYIASILLILVLFGCYGKRPQIRTGLEGKPMPIISLLGIDSSTIYNTANIARGKPTLLFSFETWCPYCKAQTKSIISEINSLSGMNIYFVCHSSINEFRKFAHQYNLDQYPIKAGVDTAFAFNEYFKIDKVPCLAIYDKDRILRQVLLGKTPVSVIKDIAFP